ncbi:MAG TPA: 5-amino-6-(D-ribitylamino)uracil--L-tyrosine 4-hydroxyphenyl transferase CofH [Acidimicrobiia bacterium]
MTITFCRLRPAHELTETIASTRHREGTTALEVEGLSTSDVEAACKAKVLPVAVGPSENAAAFVLKPAEFAQVQVTGERLTILHDGAREEVVEALARSGARYLRTGRSRVAEAAELAALPGITCVVSVFADDVETAVAAVAVGAGDLVLRDWNAEAIGELRDALAPHLLVERVAIAPDYPIDRARQELAPAVYTAWLGLIDGSGNARPRTEWAPGKDMEPPVPARRLSAAWSDPAWLAGEWSSSQGAGELGPILERSLEGTRPSLAELQMLLRARGDQVDAVAAVADQLRQRTVGDTVTYVINRNINYTNQCYFRCGFCAFSKGPRSLNLRGDPYLMSVDQVVHLAEEAVNRGATEVTLQGGIHPGFTGDFYLGVVRALKERLPDLHIHGFTPLEVWQGAETLGITVREFLTRLRDAGLGTLPGTAAEILDDRVRAYLCPDKIRTAQWAEVMMTAHALGLRATATIMFGHIDDPESWANHLEVIRQIQMRTGGFTEFVPLPFVHMGAPIFLQGRSRPGPTWDEVVLIHSVARIAFDGLIPNIQASWVKLGLDGGRRLLDAGCNDLGGTLMGEIITRSAGAAHGTEVSAEQFEEAIRQAGRVPARRDTVYRLVDSSESATRG